MKIEITEDFITGMYNWVLYDGPENIDEFRGYETTLGEVFEKIVYYRTQNALSYREDTSNTKEISQ
jgi:hypothetical protein